MDEHEVGYVAGVSRGFFEALFDLLRRKRRTPMPPASGTGSLPPRNPCFTGREELLTALHRALTSARPGAATQAIVGLGGVGKTLLATEYAYRHAKDYDLVWWVRSEEPATLAWDYAALSRKLNLPGWDSADLESVVGMTRDWLHENGRWLLVFDNVPVPADVKKYLPASGSGHVIITSRHPTWPRAETIKVEVLPRTSAIEFLCKRTKDEDSESASRLADELGCLPLALEQAGAYVCEVGGGLRDYLALLRENLREALKWRSADAEYPESVAGTWLSSFRQVEVDSPAAAQLMNTCAFLAPDSIPLEVFLARGLPEPLRTSVQDRAQRDRLLAGLLRFSLVERSGDTLTVHRLVQSIARDRLKPHEQQAFAAAAAEVVSATFPVQSHDIGFWPECGRLLSHARAAAAHAVRLGTALRATGRLLNQVGLYLLGRALYVEAEPVFKLALDTVEKEHGPEHPFVAVALNNLAGLYWAQGRIADAEPLHRRALAIREKQLGPDHADVAASLNNLALVYHAQGKTGDAESLYRRALAIREQQLGPEHHDVAASLNNLASLLQDQGSLAEAEPLFRRALETRIKHFGPNHPEVASSLNNLAELLKDQGRPAEAEPLYLRTCALLEQAYGADDPRVAFSLANLAELYCTQHRYAEAELPSRRAAAIAEKSLGEEHPDTKLYRQNLEQLLAAKAADNRQDRRA